jgi:ribosomal protein S13
MIYGLSYLLIQEFNINPESFMMCLDVENRKKLRNYAITNYNTDYYLRKEKKINLEEGDDIEEYVDIRQFMR